MENDKKDPARQMPTPAEIGGSYGSSALKTLLTNSLKDMYQAENELLKALPLLRDKATTTALKMAIEEHISQTEMHVTRVEEAFTLLGEAAEMNECKALTGLLEESDAAVDATEPGTMTRDACIVMAAQKVEHYEIATYGSLVEFSRTLGFRQIAGLLNATLDEEKMADQGLSIIARTGINWNAEHEAAAENTNEVRLIND